LTTPNNPPTPTPPTTPPFDRDLKMDNTLLDDNDPPRIKLCDVRGGMFVGWGGGGVGFVCFEAGGLVQRLCMCLIVLAVTLRAKGLGRPLTHPPHAPTNPPHPPTRPRPRSLGLRATGPAPSRR
jgi:hypothetical protein